MSGNSPGCDIDFPPSFFVMGAPRCGTTTLTKCLRRHPQVSFSRPKESMFLLGPGAERPPKEARRLYLETYHRELSARHRAIGDGSVMYLYSPEVVARALSFDPRVRFVVHVRNPLEMIPSYHARLCYMLDEDESDLLRAWELQERRERGSELPKRCRDPRMLRYGDIGMLGRHLARLFEAAGRDRCHVVLFDDWSSRPRCVYRDVLGFLDLDDDGREEFNPRRMNRGFRSRRLQVFATRRFPGMELLPSASPWLAAGLHGLRSRVKELNTVPVRRPPLPAATRARLVSHFAADVEHLSKLIDRDLGHWLREAPAREVGALRA